METGESRAERWPKISNGRWESAVNVILGRGPWLVLGWRGLASNRGGRRGWQLWQRVGSGQIRRGPMEDGLCWACWPRTALENYDLRRQRMNRCTHCNHTATTQPRWTESTEGLRVCPVSDAARQQFTRALRRWLRIWGICGFAVARPSFLSLSLSWKCLELPGSSGEWGEQPLPKFHAVESASP